MKKDDEPVKTYIPTKDNEVLEMFWYTGETVEIVKDGMLNVWSLFYGSNKYIKRDMTECVN
jgi:hypothetical protein